VEVDQVQGIVLVYEFTFGGSAPHEFIEGV
jgi:hypothetical protein